jgi:aminoglycoside/choline kinase family phosphotransferase
MTRAVEFANDATAHRLRQLAQNYDAVIEQLVRLPRTFIHGEFYASNLLVEPTMRGLRICPVDWEMAAIAPGIMDVAALAAGSWTEEQKTRMALAYHTESSLNRVLSEDEFMNAFDYCRVHQAVQWLGWTRDWDVPPEHAHDWLNEALTCAERHGLLK